MDESEDTTRPVAIERWIEATFRGYRFGVVLTLLLVTYGFVAASPTGAWTRVVTTLLQGLTLLAALRASLVGRRLLRVAAAIAAAALLASVVSLFVDSSDDATGVFQALNVLMVAAAPVVIVRALWRRSVVDIRTALGAICIYVFFGMMFAFTYSAVGQIGSEPFFTQTSTANIADYLYFSFITLTTTGYGDYTAAAGLGRSLASLEALLGQIYLVTVVAVIVSTMSRFRRAEPPGQGEVPDAGSGSARPEPLDA